MPAPPLHRSLRTWLAAAAVAGLVLLAAAGSGVQRHPAAASSRVDRPAPAHAYGRLPLAFEPNAGRFDPGVRYVARAAGYTLLVRRDGTEMVVPTRHGAAVLRTTLAGSRAGALAPAQRLPGRLNLLLGNDPRRWQRGLSMFGSIRARAVYPGIDVVYHGSQRRLEYDFDVAPGADPSSPALRLDGARRLRLTADGDLLVALPGGATVREQRPLAYQRNGTRRVPVSASFVLAGSRVRFRVGAYDHAKPLVIDPVAGYSSFVGGTGDDSMVSVATGSDGSAYVEGNTTSTSYPGLSATSIGNTGPGNQDPGCSPDCSDIVVTKLGPDGSAADWVTIFGGKRSEHAGGIALGQSIPGVYASGTTESQDFPAGTGQVLAGLGAFIAKLKPDGSGFDWATLVNRPLVNSTGYGSTEAAPDLADSSLAGGGIAVMPEVDGTGTPIGYDQIFFVGKVHSAGHCTTACTPTCTTGPCAAQLYVFGQNAISANAPQNDIGSVGDDAFVIGIEATSQSDASAFFGSFLGGSNGDDLATAVAGMAGTNDMWVTGFTKATNFPVKDPGHGFLRQTAPANSNGDGFVEQLQPWNSLPSSPIPDPSSPVVGAGYLGGTARDYPNAIATQVVPSGGCCKDYMVGLVGSTFSSDFPQAVSSGDPTTPFGTTYNAGGDGRDGFYAEMNADFSNDFLDESAYVGGSGSDSVAGIAANPTGGGWQITGTTKSTDFPLYNDTLDGSAATGGGSTKSNAFVAEPGGYSSFLDVQAANDKANGVAVDAAGRAYVVGSASSSYLTTAGAYETLAQGGTDGFATRVDVRAPVISAGPSGLVTTTAATFNYNGGPVQFLRRFECRLDGGGFTTCGSSGTSGSKAYPGPIADGGHTFQVREIDPAGLPSQPASRSFTIDTHPPTGVAPVSPVGGATTDSSQPTFTWSAGSDATTAIAGYALLIDGTKVADVAPSACSGGQCSREAPAGLPNGPHTWGVQATDTAGNSSAVASASFGVAVAPAAAFVIAPNPVAVGRTVTFDASSTKSATSIARYEWDLNGDGTFETDAGTNPVTTATFPQAGTFNVTLRVTDASGLQSTATQPLKVSSVNTPDTRYGVTIDNAAQYTNDPHVKLTVVYPPLTTSILVSNDGGFGNPTTFIPIQTLDWTLDVAGPERLPKTVYVRYLPSVIAGLTFTDDIILDTRPPDVSSASLSPAAAAAGVAARTAKVKTWTLKVKAKDDNSGVASIQATSSKRKPGPLIAYRSKLRVKAAKAPKFVRARDRAGNFSNWKPVR